MEIAFVHNDEYMDDVNGQQAVIDLADFLFQEKNFLDDVADGVLNNFNVTKFQFWRIAYLRKIDKKKKEESRKIFTDLLANVFEMAWFPPKGQTEIDYLRRLRGAVLEVLVKRFLLERYPSMGCNCRVFLDGNPLINSKGNPKTVDVAGVDKLHDPGKGELFECKVGGHYIKDYNLIFLGIARKQLDQEGLCSLLLALVSFENERCLQSIFKRLKVPEEKTISREKLKSLISYDRVKAALAV